MSIHHYNRLLAHADLSDLSPLEKLVAVFIAEAINSKKPDLMRLSAAYIAERLDLSLEAVQKATASLVAWGIFTRNSDTRRPRSGYVYALAVTCPADCEKVRAHKTKLELDYSVIGVENASLIGDKKDSSSNSLSAQNGVTKQDKQDNQDLTENSTVNGTKQHFSFEQFHTLISELTDTHMEYNSGHYVVYEQADIAYLNALAILENANRGRGVSDPSAYIAKIFTDSPFRFLVEVPGSSTERKVKSANGGKSPAREDYEKVARSLAESLGIDYDYEFGASARERGLRSIHSQRGLTAADLVEVYNSVREPSEWLQSLTSPY